MRREKKRKNQHFTSSDEDNCEDFLMFFRDDCGNIWKGFCWWKIHAFQGVVGVFGEEILMVFVDFGSCWDWREGILIEGADFEQTFFLCFTDWSWNCLDVDPLVD
jgi:hypothetical protein